MHVVLVPEFWLRADAWDAVAPVVRAAGHSVEAVTRHGETLDAQVQALVGRLAQVATAAEPVALVGHSAAGPVVAMAADRRPGLVAHLVYVDTFPGPTGGCVDDGLTVVDGRIPLPAWDWWGPASVRGLSDADRRAFAERAVPEPAALATDRFHYGDPRRHAIPATVVSCEIAPDELAGMIADHQAWATELVAVEELEVLGLDTGHWPMLTAPRALGALVVRALAPRPTDGP